MTRAQSTSHAGPGELSTAPRLRIGLFAATRTQPRAIVEAFAGIAASDYAEIVAIAAGRRAEPELSWLWRACRRIDRWISAGRADAAEAVDLAECLDSPHVLEMPERLAEYPIVDIWLAEVLRLRLDVAFVLGDIDEQAIKGVARFGAWRFGFGAGASPREGLEGFREVADGSPMTVASLRATLAGEGERLLYESRSRTASFSLFGNRDKLLRRAARFPGRVLREVHRRARGDCGKSAECGQPMSPALPPRERDSAPDPTVMRGLARIGERIVRRGLEKLFCVDQWFIAYRFSDSRNETSVLGKYRCLMPPRDRFWADPFALERDGRHFIFFEELVFSRGKAHIAVVEIDRDGRCSVPQRVLERPYHLSYPFLIESDGQLFMVPETGQNGSVELYRCLHFPDRWVLEKVLLRAPRCLDATFHRADGKWWMFVNIGADDAEAHDELHLYHADSLCGEWRAHRLNPIKSDVRSARSAGRLYERNGILYRPAQIGAPLYGSGISLNRVVRLDTEDYSEREVGRIVPPNADRILGVHTFNRAGSLHVVDGFVRRKRWGPARVDIFEPARLAPDCWDESVQTG